MKGQRRYARAWGWVGLAWVLTYGLGCSCNEKPTTKKNAPALAPPSPPTESDEARTVTQARELARAVDQDVRQALSRLLTGDEETARWAAFGLGQQCRQGRPVESAVLANALASWLSRDEPVDASTVHTAAWALGTCGGDRAEDVLRGFVSAHPDPLLDQVVQASATGLGALADRQGQLSERTQTGLLDAAEREGSPFLLYPLGRLRRLEPAVGARVLEVAGTHVTGPAGPHRRHAIFALGSSGAEAALPLQQILESQEFTSSERAAAAQALQRLGPAGQTHLERAVAEMLRRGLPTNAEDDRWVPWRAALETLDAVDDSREELIKFASLELPAEATDAQRRRLTWLRCRTADLIAGADIDDKRLANCAPEGSVVRALAFVRVLDRGPLEGPRRAAWLSLLDHAEPEVVQAALRLIATHPELTDTPALLVAGLEDENFGTVATAAQLVAAYPHRASGDQEGVAPQITESLDKLLGRLDTMPPETGAAVIAAAGASGALTLKPAVEKACDGPEHVLHEAAERALGLLGSPKRKCPSAPPENKEVPPTAPPPAVARVTIQSDVGELSLYLDEPASPQSRAHVLNLIKQGHYDGLRVQGATPGFAVQFGDPNADGYDDERPPGLPYEASPSPFGPFSVGMSAFSPGTQNNQLFVTVADAPQLTGRRVRLGRAEGPWHLLLPGDELRAFSVEEPPAIGASTPK